MGVVILVLILLSAFFSAIETAFSFVNKVRVQRYKDDGNKKAAAALYIIEHFDNALTTILICNNVVNLSCSSIATVLCMNLFGDAGSAIATGATTFLVLTFGEIVPKCLAKEHCDAFSLKTAGLLRGLMTLLTPLVWIFTRFKMIALKIAGSSGDAPSVTENELKYIVESIEEEGVLEESESEMVRSALDFDETTAEEILTPRVDITFISVDDSPEKIKDIIIENRYSRIPVYEGTVDHVVGILHTRDYLERLADGKAPDVKELMQPPYFVFKTQQLSKILNAFKRTKIHLAGYKKGKPVICTVKSTSGVQKFQMTDVKMVTLTINKILHGDEIVWGQGNPAFTFTVKGTDLDGEERIYSKTVEFTKENTDTRADVSKRAVFALPAGKYQVQESKVMRYKLEKIDQVVNGTVQGNTDRKSVV